MSLTYALLNKFQSGQYYDFYNLPDSYQPAYHRTDLHLMYAPDSRRWSVDLFMHNVENAIIIADESESFAPPLTQPGTYNVGFQSPRTYGVTLEAHY